MFRDTMIVLRLSARLLGVFSLCAAPASVRAAGILSTSPAQMDGVVVAATDTTLQLHPPIGADVTLNLTEDTRFQQAGSHTADTAPPHPLAGQYARARYDRNTLIAAQVVLTPPVPLPA